MKLLLCCLMMGVALGGCQSSTVKTSARPPATKAEPVTDTLHGAAITDNYRWLEGDISAPADRQKVTPDVAAWTDAQNGYTRAVLDQLPGRKALEERLRPLMEIGSVSAPAMRGTRYFLSKREGTQNQPVHYWRDSARGKDRVLVDPAVLDPSGLTTVEWLSPSADGRLAAYGTYRAGDENTTLHLIDVDTGKPLPLEIPNKTQAPDWLPDGSGFVYQNLKNPKDPYSGQVMYHRMGDPVAKDTVLFRQYTAAEDATLSTTWGPFGSLSRDGRWLVLGYWVDTKSNDLWLVDFDRFRKTGKIEKKIVSVGVPGLAVGTVIDSVLYVQTTKGAAKGRIVAVDAAAPDLTKGRDLVPERDNAVIESVGVGEGPHRRVLPDERLEHDRGLRPRGREPGHLDAARHRLGQRDGRARPHRGVPHVHELQLPDHRSSGSISRRRPSAGTLWEQPKVPVDPSTVEVEQVWYPSKDGTKVSMFLVHKKGLAKNGRIPTLLTGYGGFNISETPGVLRDAVPVVRGRRRVRAAQPARRRRVRRRLARGRDAREEAERLRRLHRRRRVAHRRGLHRHVDARRSPAARTAAC